MDAKHEGEPERAVKPGEQTACLLRQDGQSFQDFCLQNKVFRITHHPTPKRSRPTKCWTCSASSLDRDDTTKRKNATEQAKPRREQRPERSGAERNAKSARQERQKHAEARGAKRKKQDGSSRTQRRETKRNETRREGNNPSQAKPRQKTRNPTNRDEPRRRLRGRWQARNVTRGGSNQWT